MSDADHPTKIYLIKLDIKIRCAIAQIEKSTAIGTSLCYAGKSVLW